MKLFRLTKAEWVWLIIGVCFLTFLLTGCGTKREEVQRVERQDETTTKTTTTQKVTKPTPTGAVLVEQTDTVTFTEQVAKGTTDAQITSRTTIEAPELKAAINAAASIAAPGIGGILSGALGWLTSTPEGAATGLGVGTLLAGLVKRGVSGELKLRKTQRHFRAVVKGNSDFMQAHPEHADKLKQAQRSAQADPALKASVVAARVDQGQV